MLMRAFLSVEIPNIFALKRLTNFKTLLRKLHLSAVKMQVDLNTLNAQKKTLKAKIEQVI